MCLISIFKRNKDDNGPMIDKRNHEYQNQQSSTDNGNENQDTDTENQNTNNTLMNLNLKTNKGLVEYCEKQLGRPYWYGSFGQISTPYLLKYNKGRFPQYYTASDFENQMGVKVHDCIGLVKGYFWSKDPEDPKPVYAQGFPDVSADMQYNRSKKKGSTMDTLPEVPGVLVFLKGHVGVYIGNGWVIEARGHKFGVVKTKLKDRPWKKWAYIDELEYLE